MVFYLMSMRDIVLSFFLSIICALNLLAQSSGRDLLATAQTYIGVPYVAGTLERPGAESLVLDRRGVDCWTFVEGALAKTLAQKTLVPEETPLQQLRYRRGQINGYGSRIHYFTEWAIQAQSLGVLQDITASIGGVPYVKKVDYMTFYAEKYPRLNEPGAAELVKLGEQLIQAASLYYIPKHMISRLEHLLLPGDIVATTAANKHLDVTHQGFVVFQKGRAHLLHASSKAGAVVISRLPLAAYVLQNNDQTGIYVLRPVF
jgi:hypothetical protein